MSFCNANEIIEDSVADGFMKNFVEFTESLVKVSLIINTTRLNILDHLSDRRMTAEELASITGTHAPSLYRTLRSLSSFGYVCEHTDNSFNVTEKGKWFMEGKASIKNAVKLFCGANFDAFMHLSHTIQTGESAFDNEHGKFMYEYFPSRRDSQNAHTNFMTTVNMVFIPLFLRRYDVTQFRRIIDVGGGNGQTLFMILEGAPNAKGIVLDQRLMKRKYEENSHSVSENIRNRCIFQSGDFFESVPGDGDCYILKFIVCNWSDEMATKILSNVKRNMSTNTKLLLFDFLVTPPNQPNTNKFMDCIPMATLTGKFRMESEIQALLMSVGLRINKIIKSDDMYFDVLEVTL